MTKADQKLVDDFLRVARVNVPEMLEFATMGLAEVAHDLVGNPELTAEEKILGNQLLLAHLQLIRPIQTSRNR